MPKLQQNEDAEERIRFEMKKRKISAQRTASLLTEIEKLADQQKQQPHKPAEIRKFIAKFRTTSTL
jgi:membrane protein involved in colicin uptake